MPELQVVSQPNNLPTEPLKVTTAPQPQQPLKVVSATSQPSVSVQPLPPQPTIIPPSPQAGTAPTDFPKLAADITAARSRTKDDTAILRALLQKQPQLIPNVKEALETRSASPTQILDHIVQKYSGQQTQPDNSSPVYQFFKPLLDPTTGAAKALIKHLQNAGEMGAKALNILTGQSANIQDAIPKELLEPTNTAQKIGSAIETGAEFLLPAGAEASAIKGAESVTAKLFSSLPETSQKLINTFARSVISGTSAAGVSKLQGSDNEETVRNALLSGLIPVFGAAVDSFKGTASQLGRKIETSIVKPTQADLKDGFNINTIFKYDLGGSLQQTAQKTNNLIADLSSQLKNKIGASDATIDLNALLSQTAKDLRSNKTATFGMNTKIKNAIDFLRDEIKSISKDGEVSLVDAQQVKRSVGKLGAWLYGARDPESNAIETAANNLYTKLKTAIEQVAPPEVADINRELSELIPVENALIRRVPVAERGNVFGLGDLVSALPAVHEIKNPANLWLFGLNKLMKSGNFANLLMKAGKAAETRGAVKTIISGSVRK